MTTTLQVSIEQASMNALAAWLTASLPAYSYNGTTKTDTGVLVSDRWPDPDRTLPGRGVTVLRAGEARDTETQPEVTDYEAIHAGVSTVLRYAAPTTVVGCSAVLNAYAASYEAHRVDVTAHASADTVNAVTAPTATDQTTAEALANNLIAVLVAHRGAAAHTNADGATTLTTTAPITPGSLPALIAATVAIQAALNAHYVARIYLWRVAEIDQPLQLDVWATTDVGRDDVIARLSDILHAGPGASAGDPSDNPVAPALELVLADGWSSAHAEVAFGAPSVIDTGEAKQRDEYRATYRGSLTVARIVRAQSPRLTRAQLVALVGTAAPGSGSHTSTATVARVGTTTTTTFVP
jgi:hypothetical protein